MSSDQSLIGSHKMKLPELNSTSAYGLVSYVIPNLNSLIISRNFLGNFIPPKLKAVYAIFCPIFNFHKLKSTFHLNRYFGLQAIQMQLNGSTIMKLC